jgi:inner membrane transporter RhtA
MTSAPATERPPRSADRSSRIPAPALVLAAIISVQSGSAVARLLFDRLPATTVVLLRLLSAGVLLAALTRPRFWTWPRQTIRAALALGVAMSVMNLAFYESLRTVPLGVAVTVEFCGPLLLALVQTRRPVDFLWALAAAAGVALLGLGGGVTAPLHGLALAFAAGLCWAAYIVTSARVGAALPGSSGLAASLVVGTVLAAVVTSVRAPASIGTAVADPGLLGRGLAVGLLSSLVPYSMEMAALRRLPTRVFGVLMSLEPLAATVAGLLILHQSLTSREAVALVLVSVASVGITLAARPVPPSPPLPEAG